MACVIELVGPAGAGKTTLLGALAAGPERIVPAPDTSWWGYLRALPKDARLWAPDALRGRPPSWETLRSMVYLRDWHATLSREKRDHPDRLTLHVLDHGPIFRLVKLGQFDPRAPRGPAFTAWLEAWLQAWRSILDLVIWVDAPDEVLHERIQHRDQQHELQGGSLDASRRLLEGYRAAYGDVLARACEPGGPRVLKLATHGTPPDALADRVREELGRTG